MAKIKAVSSRKIKKNSQEAASSRQVRVRKLGDALPAQSILDRLKVNMSQLVIRLSAGGKVQAYELIASRLSALAGLNNGHSWGWRYVASVQAGTVTPSKKFVRAWDLYSQNINPRQKQWFYFAHRRYVAAVYNKSIMAEIIRSNMHAMGYKPVSFSRYLEIKKIATRRK